MADDLAVLVVVDVLAEVVDVAGGLVGGEVVAGDFDELAVLGLAFFEDAALDAVDVLVSARTVMVRVSRPSVSLRIFPGLMGMQDYRRWA